VAFVLVTIAPTFTGKVIYVDDDGPADFNNIQAAIDAAYDGDTIIVANGIYTGPGNRDIDFLGKAITLRSAYGPENCIIDVNASQSDWHNGFYLHQDEDEESIIDGFTITGGYTYHGGGIECDRCSPTIRNCIIMKNIAGWGGGITLTKSNASVSNCLISQNEAWDCAGGFFNWYHSNAVINNCTITGNTSQNIGGILCYSSKANMNNCILWANRSRYDREFGLVNSHGIRSLLNVSYCDILGGKSSGYVDPTSKLNWGTGNIDADPCFVQPGYWDSNDTPQDPRDDVWIEGDYHLLPGSPCINAGDPNYIADPNETDLDGKPRVMGGRIDMGAYEFIPLVAEVRIIPRTINLESKGKWITCYIWLPLGYDVADIDPNSVFLGYEIQPEQLFVNEREQVVTAIFSREEVQAVLNIGEVELTINAQLTDGTYFEGTDVIKVIDKDSGQSPKNIQASNPNPADGATNVSTNADLSWTASPYATSHNVYFGTSSPPPFVCNQTATTFDPSPDPGGPGGSGRMAFDTTYYWHIDEVSKWGITTGQLWRFTTLRYPGPGTTGPGTTGPGTTGPRP
jgi:hypothetical protein